MARVCEEYDVKEVSDIGKNKDVLRDYTLKYNVDACLRVKVILSHHYQSWQFTPHLYHKKGK